MRGEGFETPCITGIHVLGSREQRHDAMFGHTGIDLPQTARPFGQRPLLAIAKPLGQFSDEFSILAALPNRGSPCSSSVLLRGELLDFLNVEALSQRHEEAQ